MNLKRFIAILLPVALLFLTACGDGAPSGMEAVDTIPVYAENTVDYTMFVPEDWTVTMANGVVAAVCSDADPVSVSITNYSIYGNTSVQDEWLKLKSQTENAVKDFTLISEPDYENESSGIVTVADTKGAAYEYSAVINKTVCQYEQVLFIRDAVLYVFTYSASAEAYQTHKADAESILAELTFAKNAVCPEGMKPAVTSETKYALSDKYILYVDKDWTIDASSGVLTASFASLNSNVTVLTATVDDTIGMDGYLESSMRELKSTLPSFELLSESNDKYLIGTKDGRYSATEWEYKSQIEGQTYRFCQVICKAKTDIFILTFSTTEAYYENHISYFTKLLDAFRIVEG